MWMLRRSWQSIANSIRADSQQKRLTFLGGGYRIFLMKITAKSRYALRMLLDIAVSGDGRPRTIKEIAASQGISQKFISRLAVPLRRAGLLATERGVNGGLRLSRQVGDITLLDIVEATDGRLSLLKCLSHPGACRRQGHCAAENAWRQANESFARTLRSIRLSSIVEESRRISREDQAEPDYCI